MEKIYKYELPVDGDVIIIKDTVVRFLDVQDQNGIPAIWAIVDLEKESEPIEIIAIGTGWELLPGLGQYLGTAQDDFGFVWHYFIYKKVGA